MLQLFRVIFRDYIEYVFTPSSNVSQKHFIFKVFGNKY